MKNRAVYFLPILLIVFSCGKTQPPTHKPQPPQDYVIPQAPATPVEANLFAIEYFVSMPTADVISKHITNYKGKKPLVYTFGNSKYVPGKSNELIIAALSSKCFPFFLQAGATSFSGNGGTGFLTKYNISNFDGSCTGIPYGGPTVPTTLSSTVNIGIYFCNCSKPQQLSDIIISSSKTLYGDAVIFGQYDGDAEEMKKYAESKSLGMRFDYIIHSGKCFYTLMQPGFVNRGFETISSEGKDYIKITIEKLY